MISREVKPIRQRTNPVYHPDMTRLERITSNPEICHGQPTIRGMRYTVESLLELLASGMTNEEILADYEDLANDDILAALEFAALSASGGRVIPLASA
jgi:uncharacterized protein (DUF433 family)